MNLKLTGSVLAAALLIGCTREKGDAPREPGSWLQAPTIDPATDYVAFAGQSNVLAGNGLSDAFTATANTLPIECAVGGTYLSQWQKGQDLYENCLAKMKAHPPKALIWWQGEAEAHDPSQAQQWRAQYEPIIRAMRQDLGYELPVIFAQLGNCVRPSEMCTDSWQEVRRQQAGITLAKAWIVDTTFIDSYRRINSDGNVDVHFTREGYMSMGRRFAQEYAAHVNQGGI